MLARKPRFTESDHADLAELQQTVTTGLQHFAAAGSALAEIKRRKLYFITHDSFEAYVNATWKISRQHAYKLIEAATIAHEVSGTSDIQPNYSQAVALAELPADARVDTWEDVTSTTNPERITAERVREVAEKHAPKRRRRAGRPRTVRFKVPGAHVTVKATRKQYDLVAALEAALDQAKQRQAKRKAA